jgi:hypothetical protein
MVVMAISLGGNYIKPYLTFIPQEVFNFLEQKKMYVLMINFFVIGQVSSYLTKTGAFEVNVNGTLVLSKLKDNILATTKDIVGVIETIGLELNH